MCFVLDVNSVSSFFRCAENSEGSDFEPLFRWLFENPKTSLVIGGKRYKEELSRCINKYRRHLLELKRARKLSEISDAKVDAEELRLKSLLSHRDFDDQHIVALFCVSGCLLFASKDARSDPFIKNSSFYPKGQDRPRIYRTRNHRSLLTNSRIVKLRNTQE